METGLCVLIFSPKVSLARWVWELHLLFSQPAFCFLEVRDPCTLRDLCTPLWRFLLLPSPICSLISQGFNYYQNISNSDEENSTRKAQGQNFLEQPYQISLLNSVSTHCMYLYNWQNTLCHLVLLLSWISLLVYFLMFETGSWTALSIQVREQEAKLYR